MLAANDRPWERGLKGSAFTKSSGFAGADVSVQVVTAEEHSWEGAVYLLLKVVSCS